ncbi:hypothetical protein [Haliangium ochraceum]|uniref:Uncharacterized protein n=1 Tax=Haliangium ochraceum (strain DSM 14365 / JCM 11303 / SMP-2) TaxID=502025 RepID=D0LL08_HALO1|nr:hypothetical protein [Haliangium ochraceum]ACY16728.1 hypothetical protein Hoch_4231 [Haliangium ochraceum DSM 14365]
MMVIFAALVGACGGGSGPAPAIPAGPAFPDQTPVRSTVLAWLPADTELVLVSTGLRPLARELGWQEVARRFPEIYARTQAMAVELFDRDVLALDELAAAGLDLERPMGAARLPGDTWVFFAPVADEDAFVTAAVALAPLWNHQLDVGQGERGQFDVGPFESPEPEPEPDTEVDAEPSTEASAEDAAADADAALETGPRVLGPPYEDGWRLVLREGVALLVVAADDAAAAAAAENLATAGDARSLATSPAAQRAMGALRYGIDVAAYAAGPMLPAWARELGFDPAQGVALGVDVDAATLRARLLLPIVAGGLLDLSLRTPAQPPALPRSLQRRPLALFDAVFDARSLAALPLADRLAEELRALTGLSLRDDIVPLLSGEVGVVIEAARDADDEDTRVLEFHALAEVEDSARAAALLTRVMNRAALAGRVREAGTPGHFRVRDGAGRAWQVGVSGSFLYASTSWTSDTLPIASAGKATLRREALRSDTLAALFLAGDTTMRASVLASLLAEYLLPPPPVLPAAVADLGAGADEFTRARAELAQAKYALAQLERAAHDRRTARARALLAAAGLLAVRVDRGEGVLTVHGAQVFGRSGMPGFLARVLDVLTAQSTPEAHQALIAARERVWQARRALEAATPEPEPVPEPAPADVDAGGQEAEPGDAAAPDQRADAGGTAGATPAP